MGSKEGWTPAAFKSSRQDRAKDSKLAPQAQQRPDDFMDEEDIREAEESRQLSTAAEYAGLGSTDEDSKRRETLMDIFRPSGETIGVKLLRRMGWKEGQGIGPKVRRKAYVNEEEDDQDSTTHLFAPEDPPMILFNRKLDHKGLGFKGESGLEGRSTRLSASAASILVEGTGDEDTRSPAIFGRSSTGGKTGHQVKKGGFGVGILNETGSDEDDPYQMGPKISYNRVMGGSKKSQKKRDAAQTASNPLLKERPVFTPKKLKSTARFRKCHDGRLPLDGFVLSTELDSFGSTKLEDDKYKPPKVPEGWVSAKKPSHSPLRDPYILTAEAASHSGIDAKARAAILGEEQLPGKSVFDFLTPAARERIVTASGNRNLPAALSEKPPVGFELRASGSSPKMEDLVPKLDVEVAVQALSRGVGGWMPYAEDEDKRARYRAFLEIRAGIRNGLPERPEEMSRDGWVNEMHEFSRAAQVFRPVTGLMASRFTSSSSHPKHASDGPDSSAERQALLSQPAGKPEDAAVKAAKMGMFGPLTRSVKDFYPTRLLCKRFNVKAPAHVQLDAGNNNAAKHDVAAVITTTEQRQASGGDVDEKAGQKLLLQAGVEAKSRMAKLVEMTDGAPGEIVDPGRNEALEAERPGEDVFKAIFGSDDDGDG